MHIPHPDVYYVLAYMRHMFSKQSEHQLTRDNHSLPLSPIIIAQGRQHRPTCPYHSTNTSQVVSEHCNDALHTLLIEDYTATV